ncbi:MAG: stage V sporulation protein AA [Lachnospiraceae bacterium]|nr:stage V sporulation protein AA [Lachnospiraceae bacterium]
MDKQIYMQLRQHSAVRESRVSLKDLGEVFSNQPQWAARAKAMTVCSLQKPGDRAVFSSLFLIEKIKKEIPDCEVINLGETDMIVEWEVERRENIFRLIFVCLILFFGTAFTIMAFHNDVDIRGVFEQVYLLSGAAAPDGAGLLEVSYCIGLFVGITVFFNHLGKRKLKSDPTPVQVSMYTYEQNVNQSILNAADREGEAKSAE